MRRFYSFRPKKKIFFPQLSRLTRHLKLGEEKNGKGEERRAESGDRCLSSRRKWRTSVFPGRDKGWGRISAKENAAVRETCVGRKYTSTLYY